MSDKEKDRRREIRCERYNKMIDTKKTLLGVFSVLIYGLIMWLVSISKDPEGVIYIMFSVIYWFIAYPILHVANGKYESMKYTYAKSEYVRDYYGDKEAERTIQRCNQDFKKQRNQYALGVGTVALLLGLKNKINNEMRDNNK